VPESPSTIWKHEGVAGGSGRAALPDQYHLIDGQVDQPAGPMLGGGGPVSKNRGVGEGKLRFKSNAGRKNNDHDGL
jgi:hypothetical protein